MKIKYREIIICVLIFILIAVRLFMPKTGPLVMINEVCDVFLIWMICIIVIISIIKSNWKNSKFANVIKVALIIICVALGIWFSRNVVLDFISGPKKSVLSDIQVSKTQGYTGIFSLHYYLNGVNTSGERIRLEISGSDYTKLSTKRSVLVEYYENTGRIVWYE